MNTEEIAMQKKPFKPWSVLIAAVLCFCYLLPALPVRADAAPSDGQAYAEAYQQMYMLAESAY